MVRHMLKNTTATLPEVFCMASLTPADRTGIAQQTGSLEISKLADILILGKHLDVVRVFVGGREHIR
jgi:N-acetylglucosamine-6-phosphate deacetylase